MSDITSTAALWWAVVASGFYHGINPGMGWPLAVSAALMERKPAALLRALAALAGGHFLAMTAILLPFAAMTILVTWQRELRIGAGLGVVALGIFLLIHRRHPRFLARVRPSHLALWSFLTATAHGAGLMLVPIYLGLCSADAINAGHRAAAELMGENAVRAVIVAIIHTAAMISAGGVIAFGVYRWLGLRFLSRSWFNLDILWALSLIVVGGIGIAMALAV